MSRAARSWLAPAILLPLLLVFAACTGTSVPAPPGLGVTTPAPLPSTSATATPSTPAATTRAATTPAGPAPTSEPATPRPARAKPNPISVRALIEKTYNGRALKIGRLLDDAGAYRRYLVTYRSEDLTVSGVMNVPEGEGPFPVLILAHGYIDPDVYSPGQGMAREQDYLAQQGYVVLHTDYRGHAGGDDDPDVDYELRLPYAMDVINAVSAVKASKLPYLDRDRVGLMGRSMGGNVTLNALVARPGLVDSAVIHASTSSLAADNWRQFSRRGDDQDRMNRRIARTYGLPEDAPAFWRRASPGP